MPKIKYMKRLETLCVILTAAFAGCSDTADESFGGTSAAQQQFIVAVESMGELFTGGEGVLPTLQATRRPISSVAPTQTFDKLAILIVEYRAPARVVCKRTIDDWSSPNNLSSIPWSLESGQGRYATVVLNDGECLSEGVVYMAYAIGYQSGTYDGYEPFRGYDVGDVYDRTEVASVPLGGSAEEIFAGAELFRVEDGSILSGPGSDGSSSRGVLIVRRQVAGTFGYFTRIPVVWQGRRVARLRLVATRRNRTVIFGGFSGLDNAYDFSKDNVVNGMNPRTDYDARLNGAAVNNAFTVYEIDLAQWFPGNPEDARLPYDASGDGKPEYLYDCSDPSERSPANTP